MKWKWRCGRSWVAAHDWQPVPGFWSVPVVVRTVNEAHNDGLRLVIGAGGQDG